MRVVLDLIVIRGAAAISLCTGDAPAPHKRAAVIETVRSAFKCMPGTPGHGLTGLSYTYLESEAATMTYWHGQDTPVSDAPRFARRKLTQKMELFAVLCRLRLGLAEEDIADRCGVHASTFSRIFRTWIRLMAVMLPNLFPWPSRETIDRYAPPHFRLTQRHESLLIVRNFTLNGQLL